MAQDVSGSKAAPAMPSKAHQPASDAASGSGQGVGGDIPAHFRPVLSEYDYDKRNVMIPMRDGVRLHAVIIVPHSVKHGPIMLDRTPYSADKLTGNVETPSVAEAMRYAFRDLVRDGYIVVVEDVRGKYKSNGDYVMNRPLVGPLNDTKVDHSTDAYDTIGWLVKHVPESNGRVGTIGTSYDGFTTLMSLINPNPALRAAVPINPMVDTWIGDDWFHHGAFREEMMDYIYAQTASKDSSLKWWAAGHDDFPLYLKHVSAGAFGNAMGLRQLPFWQRLTSHPAYDGFWQGQAVDKLLARAKLTVPTLFVQGQWDQEDIYGAIAAFAATAAKGDASDRFLVMGPWFHGQANTKGNALGPFDWGGDTGAWFRKHVMLPFLDARLKDGAAPAHIAPVTAFQTGSDTWRTYANWPQACAACADTGRALYLQADFGLSFLRPGVGTTAYDEYVSDPAKPVPYRLRPIRPTYADDSTWHTWLVDDQRFADGRPDVLSYSTAPLKAPVTITGAPVAHLMASTTGTDADWVVKLIDVYPDSVPDQPELGGYELGVSMDILRGRYRDDPAHPSAIPPGKVVAYTLALPNVNHVFLPGHRIMVQVQSSWFPLYDRNPQSYVPNIFFAKPGDYIKATDRVFHAPDAASYIQLPVVAGDDGTVVAGP
ncbi:CocE/NonD family hydrolase [Lichenicoccus sp.]|uniref:CocE/NonD family hydrolase n=1 Tax=Lichenicoccus sp. TaxID=2781899 RepID=UPI003D0DFA88